MFFPFRKHVSYLNMPKKKMRSHRIPMTPKWTIRVRVIKKRVVGQNSIVLMLHTCWYWEQHSTCWLQSYDNQVFVVVDVMLSITFAVLLITGSIRFYMWRTCIHRLADIQTTFSTIGHHWHWQLVWRILQKCQHEQKHTKYKQANQ